MPVPGHPGPTNAAEQGNHNGACCGSGPDNNWFGARPRIILDRRGPGIDAMIENSRAAVARYPYPHEYRAWPGPNSNTFTAFIARQVPELGLDLPSNAIGKDFCPVVRWLPRPSGSGFQVSLCGLAGIMPAVNKGLELNVLGINIGINCHRAGAKAAGNRPAWVRALTPL